MAKNYAGNTSLGSIEAAWDGERNGSSSMVYIVNLWRRIIFLSRIIALIGAMRWRATCTFVSAMMHDRDNAVTSGRHMRRRDKPTPTHYERHD